MTSEQPAEARHAVSWPTPVTIVAGGPDDPILESARMVASLDPPGTVLVTPGFAYDMPWEEVAAEEEVIAADDDCVCCALRFDLMRVLSTLLTRRSPPGRVVIALNPDADLVLAVNTFLRSGTLNRRSFVDGVVALDAACEPRSRRALERRLLADSTGESLVRALGVGSWDVRLAPRRLEVPTGHPQCVDLEVPGPLDLDHLLEWFDEVQESHGPEIVKVDGDLEIAGEERRWSVQGVRRTLEIDDGDAASGAPSRLRLLGVDLPAERLERGFVRIAAP